MSSGEWGVLLFVAGIIVIGAGSVMRRGQRPAGRDRVARLWPTVVTLGGLGLLIGAVNLVFSRPL